VGEHGSALGPRGFADSEGAALGSIFETGTGFQMFLENRTAAFLRESDGNEREGRKQGRPGPLPGTIAGKRGPGADFVGYWGPATACFCGDANLRGTAVRQVCLAGRQSRRFLVL